MIQEGCGQEEMKGFLIDKEGYTVDLRPKLRNQVSESRVQPVVTSGPPVQAILRWYYTTAVVNFISWNKAYSIFPRATFLLHETIPLKPVSDFYGSRHAKWSKRGWRLRTEAVYTSGADNEQPLGYLGRNGDRRIGDRDTWVIRLDGATQVEKSSSFVPDSVLDYSGFRVGDLNIQARDFDSMDDWQSIRKSSTQSTH
ncbi:hypothetical protein DL771_004764 [Monosporascus sp. 5C6A]|nr:hypothetical protein DL771_004764 [Monosporascus sp. 5C6A]